MNAVEPRSPWSTTQRQIVSDMVSELSKIPGIEAIVLGGSFASGFAQPDSDIDLGLLYSDEVPLPIDRLREIAGHSHDTDAPVVTELYEWGPWVNGGAWLTVRDQRVDWLYRSLERIQGVIERAETGDYETHYTQMPPFGFFGPTYLGELRIAIALHDPHDRFAALQAQVDTYPIALRRSIVDSQLWAVEFGLSAFASKFATRGDVYLVASSLARFAHQLVMVLFALNEHYPVNDKTALIEIDRFEIAPAGFRNRVESVLAEVGSSATELAARVREFEALFREVLQLAGDLYRPRRLP